MDTKIATIIVLWSVYFIMLLRAVLGQRLHSYRHLAVVWYAYFLGCVVFTLTGPEMEHYFDSLVNGLPVSVFLKYIAMIQICGIYYTQLRDVWRPEPSMDRMLLALQGVSLAIAALAFIGIVATNTYLDSMLRYWVTAGRDTVIAVYIIASFLPMTLSLLQQETIITMRVRQATNLMLFITYLFVTASSLISLVIVIFQLADIATLLPYFVPLTVMCYIWFVLVLLPHRWLMLFLLPWRWYVCFRLIRLHRWLNTMTRRANPYKIDITYALVVMNVEFAIYQTVIQILDSVALIRFDRPQTLPEALSAVVDTSMNYTDLIKQLTKVRYER